MPSGAYISGIASTPNSSAGQFSGSASGYNTPGQSYLTPSLVSSGGRFSKGGGSAAAGDFYSATGPQGSGWYHPQNTAQSALSGQQYYAQQFNQNMPTMQNQMGNQAAGQVGAQADQAIQGNKSSNASRGMLYGGVNAGQNQQIRGSAATQTANAQSNINQGLMNQQTQINAGAIQSGINYQQVQQQQANAVYQNAMNGLMLDTAETNAVTGLVSGGAVASGAMGSMGGLMSAA